MSIIHAIYQDGVFKPIEPVSLPEDCKVEVHIPSSEASASTTPHPPLLGRFAHLGLHFPKREIDEARREMWSAFPREFPVTGKQ